MTAAQSQVEAFAGFLVSRQQALRGAQQAGYTSATQPAQCALEAMQG